MNDQDKPAIPATKSTHQVWLAALGAGLLAVGGGAIYDGVQTNDLKQRFLATQKDNVALRAELSDKDAELHNTLDALREDIANARSETSATLAKAQSAASRHAEVVASRIVKSQVSQTKELSEELSKVKESTLQASTRLDGITNQVGSVKSDVETAKTDIQDTRSELQRARGDMGLMSGLVATNSKQIQMLRDLGDRNIFQFTITKSSGMQKVGDIQVELRKADPRHNRYSLELLADDKRVEKKDRSVNEPVQFYRDRARQPSELVVNEVAKNKIVGYLATPKVTVSRNEAPPQR